MSSGEHDRRVELCRINQGWDNKSCFVCSIEANLQKRLFSFQWINHWTSQVRWFICAETKPAGLHQTPHPPTPPRPPLSGEGHEMNNETSGCLLIEARSIARLTFQRYITKCSSSCFGAAVSMCSAALTKRRSSLIFNIWTLCCSIWASGDSFFLGECAETWCCITSPYVTCHTKNYPNALFDYHALLPDLEKQIH